MKLYSYWRFIVVTLLTENTKLKSHFHFNFKETRSWLRAPLSVTKSLSSGKPSIPSFCCQFVAAAFCSFQQLSCFFIPWRSEMKLSYMNHHYPPHLLICLNLVFLSCKSLIPAFNFLCLAEIAPHWTCVFPAFLLVTCSPFENPRLLKENGNLTVWLTVLVHLT